jgi:hypothetical protein
VKKYQRLKCTVCKRDIDKLVNYTHYTPDQCTITFGCQGRLQPVEYISNAQIAVAPEVGVTDWVPRGSTSTSTSGETTITTPDLINLQTGSLKQLVLAVESATEPAAGSTYILNLDVQAATPKTYRQYVYRKDGDFNTVNGVESGLEKKTLRFTAYGTNPDVVEVYVNGVKRESGTGVDDYQIYDGSGTSAVPPNTILFNTIIQSASSTQVDVIVSKAAATTTVSLTFRRNQDDESRVGKGAYENVSYVEQVPSGTRFYLYTLDLDDATSLPLNSLLVPSADAAASTAFFMLAREPYTQLDRYALITLKLAGMSIERDYIKFYAEAGETTARVTETALANVFPPLRFGKFEVEKTIKTATSGVEEQIVVDGNVITGPDA